MRKIISVFTILSLMMSFSYTPVNAENVDLVKGINKSAYNTALEYLIFSSSDPDWKGLEISKQDELFDTNYDINGYVFSLMGDDKEGYIIVKKYSDNNFVVTEASFEAKSPYLESNGYNIYLGPLNYYSSEQSNAFYSLRENVIYNENQVHDTLDDQLLALTVQDTKANNLVSPNATVGGKTYVGNLTSQTQMPALYQHLVSGSHCSPTAAANMVRYAQLYLGLQFNSNRSDYASSGGYKAFIREMGEYMGTGQYPIEDPITGTVDSKVGPGLEDFVHDHTNSTVSVSMYKRSQGATSVSFSRYSSFIDQGYPVIVTVGKGILPNMNATYHSLSGFGYTNQGYMIVSDPDDATRKELIYTTTDSSYIYAIYRVIFGTPIINKISS